MKHAWNVTLLLAGLFLASQLIGLAVLYSGFQVATDASGNQVVVPQDTVLGPRPDIQGPETLLMLFVSIGLGTGFILLVIRFGRLGLWKAFFFVAAFLSMWVALAMLMDALAALGLALLAAGLKVRSRSVIVHNVTEPFIYAGIALIMVPLLTVPWAFVMLAAISVYDFWAVFRSRHMVTMAKGLQDSMAFAGLSIPYTQGGRVQASFGKGKPKEGKAAGKAAEEAEEVTAAVLGGGDIAFPLLFTGAVVQQLMVSGIPKPAAFLATLALPAVLTVTLLLLLWKASKGKFYPAMPLLSGGCLAGYALVWLLTLAL
jgi:presenilin-like A22 family membrane protease